MSKYTDYLENFSEEDDESFDDDEENYIERDIYEYTDEIIDIHKKLMNYINSHCLPLCQKLTVNDFIDYLS